MARWEDTVPKTPTVYGRFLDEEGKLARILHPSVILSIRFEPNAEYGPRWVIDVVDLVEADLVAWTLKSNATRDAALGAAAKAIEAGKAIDPIGFYREQARAGANPYWVIGSAPEDATEEAIIRHPAMTGGTGSVRAAIAAIVAAVQDAATAAREAETDASETEAVTLPGETLASAKRRRGR